MGMTTGVSFVKKLTKENLVKWYVYQKQSQVDIAGRLGCTKALVGKYMQKFHITVRPKPEFVRLGMLKSYKCRRMKIGS